ncbi:MAG TPA: proton-conducting transporter membrane subunit, partial [Burkholderiaceae bacterium]|nr:proton-conducting transporter membrane subunit [Burkholderiaceae bacterium]
VEAIAIAAALGVVALTAALAAASADAPVITWLGGWLPRSEATLGIALVADPLGAGFAMLIAALMTVVFVFGRLYFPRIDALFHVLMLVFLGAAAGYAMTGDLFNLYVFFELIGVTAFALTAYRLEQVSLQGALNFAVSNTLGSLLLLSGIGLLYGHAGAINLAELGRILAESRDAGAGIVTTAFVLMLAGFLIKAAAVPFHFWLADAYAVAAMPVCVLFAGASVTLGAFGAARVYWTVFSDSALSSGAAATLLLGVGLATALVGALMALAERHLKRLLAFTTISHVGVLLAGLALLTADALAGAALYLLGHALAKAALFIAAGVLFVRHASVHLQVLRGRGAGAATALVLVAGGLMLAGAPPGAAYEGKHRLLEAAHDAGLHWAAWTITAASIASGAAVLRAAALISLSPERGAERHGPQRVIWPMVGIAAALLAAAFAAGASSALEDAVSRASVGFTDRAGYAAAVIDAAPRPVPAAPVRHGGGWIDGLASGALACALAAATAWNSRLPRSVRSVIGAAVLPPVRALKALHAGRLSDYVAWLMAGLALLGASLAALSAAGIGLR